jgi:hypothetical protein
VIQAASIPSLLSRQADQRFARGCIVSTPTALRIVGEDLVGDAA